LIECGSYLRSNEEDKQVWAQEQNTHTQKKYQQQIFFPKCKERICISQPKIMYVWKR
jgi:hypothetical protein